MVNIRTKVELAKSFENQILLKEQAKKDEERMEQEFKRRMLEKFREDERVEQMNAQKRRMKEQEYKREIEKLWVEKLEVYRAQREEELKERERAEAEQLRKAEVIRMEKIRLLKENADLLEKYYPKAAAIEKTRYITSNKLGSFNH